MNTKKNLCSECFQDQGLKLMAEGIGKESNKRCINCLKSNGFKLEIEDIEQLAYQFFVVGSILKSRYGAAPIIQFNKYQKTDARFSGYLNEDVHIFEKFLGVGFFHYGPRTWMIGDIEPLEDMQNSNKRNKVYEKILKEYPAVALQDSDFFYRIRINPEIPNSETEYDSPPKSGNGRLDNENFPILYGSQDLEVCIHECRVTVEDEIYVATIKPSKNLKLLDLTELIEEKCTEFESLDLAVQMLFLAGKHSYEISKNMSLKVKEYGFDGIVYPSFFSLVRTGRVPFPTVYGISNRKIPEYRDFEKSDTIQNIALFGRPIKDKTVQVVNINKLCLNRIIYDYQFGPAQID